MAANNAEEVKVLGGWASPFPLRVRIALDLKGVDYEFLEEGIEKKSELLLKSNPVYKKIPVLLHDCKPICESMIIVQYIDEVWAGEHYPSILPSAPYDRAMACFWAAFVDDKLPSSIRILVKVAEGDEGEAVEQMVSALQRLEEAFKECSGGKAFFGGDAIGYLDIALGCYLGWIGAVEKMHGVKLLDEEAVPDLVGWAARFCSADAVVKLMPEADELIEFNRVVRETRCPVPTN